MSESQPAPRPASRFSLRQLLTLTALMAVAIAVGFAFRLNRALQQQRRDLLSLSNRWSYGDEDQVAKAAMPAVANDFDSWRVRVPEGKDYELRLGIGKIAEKMIPPVVGSVRIPAGEHRITLYTGDSTSEEFRYQVYLDGQMVIEKTMGSQWMPHGWSSASGLAWPNSMNAKTPPLQLVAQSYTPRLDFGRNAYFNGNSDTQVTRVGYRLWIDYADGTYQPASPFNGFAREGWYQGIGSRDGLRYAVRQLAYEWSFTQPSLASSAPLLVVEADFKASDGRVLTSSSQQFKSWDVRNAATGTESLRRADDPTQTMQSAFLHASCKSEQDLQPVIELKWDVSQPDAVGIRLADVPANSQISRWRLRLLKGHQHLWRQLSIDDQPWLAPTDVRITEEASDSWQELPVKKRANIDLGRPSASDRVIRWQGNEELPLQIATRNDNRFAGMTFYQGLQATLSLRVPASLQPHLAVELVDQHPSVPNAPIPDGAVFDTLLIELEATAGDWIWLSAQPKP